MGGFDGFLTIPDVYQEEFLTDGLKEGGAVWITGLTFDVTACRYVIGGIFYTSDPTQVTLSAADPGNPRIDVIVADTSGTISVIEGTAAADPVKPEVDLDTQVEVTFVLVGAGATTPTGVTATDIYLEDAGDPAEWDATESTGGARITTNSAADPYQGTVSVEFTNAANGDTLTLNTPTAPLETASFDYLEFHMKSGGAWPTQKKIRLAFFNGATRVTDWVTICDCKESFGWDSTDTSTYQTLKITDADFNFIDVEADELQIAVRGGGAAISFHIDQIRYQGDSENRPTTTTFGNFTFNTSQTVGAGQNNYVLTYDDSTGLISLESAAVVTTLYTGSGSLSGNTTITGAANKLSLTSTTGTGFEITSNTPDNGDEAMQITVSDEGAGLRVDGTTNTTLTPITQNGTGRAIEGIVQHASSTNAVVQATRTSTTTSNILPLFRATRNLSSGTAANGIGSKIDFWIQNDGGFTQEQGSLQFYLADVSDGAEDSNFILQLVNNNSLTNRLEIAGDTGEITANGYGSGSITGTAAYALAVDASGKLIEESLTANTMYTVDGSIDDSLRTVTVGTNSLLFTGNGSITNDLVTITATGTIANRNALQVNGGSGSSSNALGVLHNNSVAAVDVVQNGSGVGIQVDAEQGAAFYGSNEIATTNSVETGLSLNRLTTGTPTDGLGIRIAFGAENDTPQLYTMAHLEVELSDVTDTSEEVTHRWTHAIDSGSQVRVQSLASQTSSTTFAIGNATEGGVASLNHQIKRELHTLAAANTSDTTIDIPSGALLIGVQVNVDTAVTTSSASNTWKSDFTGGSSTALAGAGTSGAQNTKDNTFIVPEVASATTNVRFTAPGAETFTAGVIEVLAYYYDFTNMANA